MYIKNISGSTGTWVGQELTNNQYFLLDTYETYRWSRDAGALAAIAAGDLTVAPDNSGNTDIANPGDAVAALLGDTQPKDADGAPLNRTKITKSGWHYQCHSIELTSSKLASLYNKSTAETDLGFTSLKFYNSSNVELVAGTQAELDSNCVKTVMDFEPTHDIEVIGGVIYQGTQPSTDIRIWVTAIPDLTVAQGGSIPFCQGGINLRYMGTGAIYDIDGKTPKLLPYDATYHTNKFRLTMVHGTGTQHTMMLVMKLFRENA